MKRWAQGLFLAAATGLVSAGCSTLVNSALDSAARSTGNTIGDRIGKSIGNQVGNAVATRFTPAMTNFYTSYLFGLAFSSGGYIVGQTDYQPGQYTRWNLPSDDEKSWLERAYLKSTDDGNQWWRVKFYDAENKETAILEGLFDAGQSKLLRLRAKFPDDKEPQELPVQDNAYYVPPAALTAESIEGATVGQETITVPAGTFNTRHVKYGSANSVTWEWWLSDEVPGGMVRYLLSSPEESGSESSDDTDVDSDNWELVLLEHGEGAVSELGVE